MLRVMDDCYRLRKHSVCEKFESSNIYLRYLPSFKKLLPATMQVFVLVYIKFSRISLTMMNIVNGDLRKNPIPKNYIIE